MDKKAQEASKRRKIKYAEDYFKFPIPKYEAKSRPLTTKDRIAFYRDISKTDVDCLFR